MAQLELSHLSVFRSLTDVLGGIVPQDSGFDGWPHMSERAGSGLETDEALRAVVSILQYLELESPATLVPATKVLADASRSGKLLVNLSAVKRTTA